jgi:tol-pal system protein YbgF
VTARQVLSLLLASATAGMLVGGVRAADTLPDRRAVRPAQTNPTAARAATGNEAVLELLSDMEELKSQLRTLRGQLETQGYQLEQMKNAQRQSALDVDRRLRELERRPGGAAAAPAAGESTLSVVPTPRAGNTPPATAAVVATAPRGLPSATEQQQYDAAFALMKQGLYQQAATRFRDFIAKNPNSPLTDNAQYWIGEAAYVTRDFRTALEEFGKVVTNYPQSPKVADALLKIGYTHYELAAYDRAREALNQVVTRYPNTAVAKSAQLRLERIAKEGK